MDIKEYIESGKIEAYLLGTLTPVEQEQVEADVARYPELGKELHAIETALHQYWLTHAAEPPAEMQHKIWNAIQAASDNADGKETKSPGANKVISFQPEYRKPNQWKYAAAWVALAGSLAANMMLWYQGKQTRDEKTSLAYRLDTLQNQQRELAALVTNYEKATNMMADTGMQTIVLHTVVKGHPMAATLYWSKGNGIAYVAMDALPQPPKGMQYQLWAIQSGKPVDMGVLPNSMANTPVIQKVQKTITEGEAFAISLEKEGGSPTPTMQNIYVMGKPS